MNQKTTVTVTSPSGQSIDRSSDTVMVFTVDGFKDVLEGKADGVNSNVSYVGKGIPNICFAEVIANMIVRLTGDYFKNPIETSFQISVIADQLKEHSKKLDQEAIDNIGEQEIKKLLLDFLLKE